MGELSFPLRWLLHQSQMFVKQEKLAKVAHGHITFTVTWRNEGESVHEVPPALQQTCSSIGGFFSSAASVVGNTINTVLTGTDEARVWRQEDGAILVVGARLEAHGAAGLDGHGR